MNGIEVDEGTVVGAAEAGAGAGGPDSAEDPSGTLELTLRMGVGAPLNPDPPILIITLD